MPNTSVLCPARLRQKLGLNPFAPSGIQELTNVQRSLQSWQAGAVGHVQAQTLLWTIGRLPWRRSCQKGCFTLRGCGLHHPGPVRVALARGGPPLALALPAALVGP